MRNASQEEKTFMMDLFKKYVEFKNTKSTFELVFDKYSDFYGELKTEYTINLFAKHINNGLGQIVDKHVCYIIKKRHIKKWAKENNIDIPRFSRKGVTYIK